MCKDEVVGFIDAKHHGGGLMGWTSQAWDIHDSFELGVEIDGEWVFGEFKSTGEPGLYEFVESKIKDK